MVVFLSAMVPAANPNEFVTGPSPAELRFLRRWECWHRRGLLRYAVWVNVMSLVSMAVVLFLVHNFPLHGVRLVKWEGFQKRDFWVLLLFLAGGLVARPMWFLDNEDRYNRLRKKQDRYERVMKGQQS